MSRMGDLWLRLSEGLGLFTWYADHVTVFLRPSVGDGTDVALTQDHLYMCPDGMLTVFPK